MISAFLGGIANWDVIIISNFIQPKKKKKKHLFFIAGELVREELPIGM